MPVKARLGPNDLQVQPVRAAIQCKTKNDERHSTKENTVHGRRNVLQVGVKRNKSIIQWDLSPRYLKVKEPCQMELSQLFRKIPVFE